MITVGVIDDSPSIRRLMTRALQADGDITVVGEAPDTVLGRAMLISAKPQVLTLDITLPGESGLDFLQRLMSDTPLPTIMVSSLTSQGADETIKALANGAVGCLQKPQCKADVSSFEATLRMMVRNASNFKVQQTRSFNRREMKYPRENSKRIELIAISASTGGIKSTGFFLTSLPPNSPPIVITQHMQPAFLAQLANRMNDEHPFDVALGREGEVLSKGMVRIAPPGHHMLLDRSSLRIVTRLEKADKSEPIVPAADPMLMSIAENIGGNVIAAVLSGMGKDGAKGMKALKKLGAQCIGESPETCVVYGMSKAAKNLGGIDKELPIHELGNHAAALMGYSRDMSA